MTVSRRTFLSGVVAAPLVPSISADEERIALHRADTGEATWAEMADTWDGLEFDQRAVNAVKRAKARGERL